MPATSPFDLELLEPRVLLSATPVPVSGPASEQAATPNTVDHTQTPAASENSNSSSTAINVFEGVPTTDLAATDRPAAPTQTQSTTGETTKDAAITIPAPQPTPVLVASDVLDTTSITEQLTETLHAA